MVESWRCSLKISAPFVPIYRLFQVIINLLFQFSHLNFPLVPSPCARKPKQLLRLKIVCDRQGCGILQLRERNIGP